MNVADLITEDVPMKEHYIVVEISNGTTYTVEADTVEELYQKVDEIERRAKAEGLKVLK